MTPHAEGVRAQRYGNRYRLQTPEADHSWRYVPWDRFEVRDGDEWYQDAANAPGGRNRCELAGLDKWPFNTDVWLSMHLRVHGLPTSAWNVLGQFHATEDGHDVAASPVFAQELSADGTLYVKTRASEADPLLSNPSAVVRYSEPDFALDVWHRFIYRLQFARTGDGYIEAWKNGAQIIEGQAIPLGYNDVVGPYFKFGIYREAAAQTMVAEYASVEVSTSSLADRITDPLPLT